MFVCWSTDVETMSGGQCTAVEEDLRRTARSVCEVVGLHTGGRLCFSLPIAVEEGREEQERGGEGESKVG